MQGLPVLAVEGTVQFDVRGWVPAHADGSLVRAIFFVRVGVAQRAANR